MTMTEKKLYYVYIFLRRSILTQCWSQHSSCMRSRMSFELVGKPQRRKRNVVIVIHYAIHCPISGLCHSPLEILWSCGRNGNVRLKQFKFDFAGIVPNSSYMHWAVLSIEWPTPVVGMACGFVKTYRKTLNCSVLLDQTAGGRFTESIFCWRNIAVNHIQCGLPYCVAVIDELDYVVVLVRIPFQKGICPNLKMVK